MDSRTASDLLHAHWTAGTRLSELPPGSRPATRAEGYEIQALLEARSSAPLFGWKIAATSVAGQRHIGVDGPLAGRILAERVHASGARLPVGGNAMRVAEPEFAFRMGRDLPPRDDPYGLDEVMAAVADLHPAIEIPDSRFENFVTAGGPQLIADNACAHDFVLGPAVSVDWRGLDLAAHEVRGTVVGRLDRAGTGANVLGDPRIALTWLANELSRHGVTLRAGQVVTTGTCVVPLEIEENVRVEADFGVLGRVAVDLA